MTAKLTAAFMHGTHPERGTLIAAIDPTVRFVEGRVAERRFSALLAPYRTAEEARAALVEAGATIEENSGS